jgi:peptide/nickel transport system substrate-binding protein
MTYTFRLKPDVLWHDGTTLRADDILFTVNLIKDPAYKSPLRINWQGIETTIVDEKTIEFKIENSYAGFLNNLTFGILPKHIWESIGPDKFHLTDLNLQPIGTGPYKFSSIQKNSDGNILSYKLVTNPAYFRGKPYISKITFNFYTDDDTIMDALNKKEIMGINSISAQRISGIKLQKSIQIHKANIPRYFAVFFNINNSVPLANLEVRKALAHATDRQEIINQVLSGNGQPVHTPILFGMIGHTEDMEKYNFDIEKANQILDEAKWERGEDGFRAKDGSVLEFSLITTDIGELVQTAEIIKSQWEKIGAKVNINSYSIFDMQQNYIRPREYDAMLYGQVLGADPDPYSFWHSSQKKDPGLNLALFGDEETDKLIMDGRSEFDSGKRADLYQEFQRKLASEVPAVFLYSPEYIYPVSRKIKGIEMYNLVFPSERFSDIDHWYIKTKRIWK